MGSGTCRLLARPAVGSACWSGQMPYCLPGLLLDALIQASDMGTGRARPACIMCVPLVVRRAMLLVKHKPPTPLPLLLEYSLQLTAAVTDAPYKLRMASTNTFRGSCMQRSGACMLHHFHQATSSCT